MAQSIIADSFDVTTLLGSHLGLSSLLPVSFEAQHEFTINNYLNIFPNTSPKAMPKLRYFGIGIKGCYNADDGILVSAFNPKRTNMNLFQPVPIRCRPVDEDLSAAERKNYRLRIRKTINGNDYFLYYLKVLTFADTIKYKQINPVTGAEKEYSLNSSYLEPTPEKQGADATITTSTAQVVAYCNAQVAVEASEILEYINAMYGDSRYARVSEIGFFTGDDQEVTGSTSQGASVTYTEAMYVQLYNHLTNTGIPLTNSGMKIDSSFEITSRGDVLTQA